MNTIPDELLKIIIDDLTDYRDYHSLAILCKRTNALCKTITEKKQKQFIMFVESLGHDRTAGYFCFDNGMLHGRYSEYVRKGELYEHTFMVRYWSIFTNYSFGKKDGKHEVYEKHYIKGQVLVKVTFYKEDKLHGAHIEFYPNGKAKLFGKYKNGLKHGIWTKCGEDGRRLRRWIYENGKKHKY